MLPDAAAGDALLTPLSSTIVLDGTAYKAGPLSSRLRGMFKVFAGDARLYALSP